MNLINYQTDVPEENLAADEYFLLKAERGEIGESLRFWETKKNFVVIGRSGKVDIECFLENCKQDKVKVLRRISGGGTVLQGAGCLNYSLILSYERDRSLEKINSSYNYILDNISRSFNEKGTIVSYCPISDMVHKNKKFSGNAQARKRSFFLHHGTILYGFDLDKISSYIKYPPQEPEYREGRVHKDFVCNLPLSATDIKTAIENAFCNSFFLYELTAEDKSGIDRLIDEKYSKESWNYAF